MIIIDKIIQFSQNFIFSQPNWFFLLALIPFYLLFLSRKKKNESALGMNSIAVLRPFVSSKQRWQKWLFPLLSTLAFSSMVIALARPQQPLRDEVVNKEGVDIILVLDISLSMLSKDFKPNRLEASKKVALDFISKRPNDRIGLVIFSGEAFTQCPLTSDHAILENILATIKTGMLSDGTAIGSGLATAVKHLKDSQTKSKIAILLTDGDNNRGYIDPEKAAELAKEFGIKSYTIGVGTIGEAFSPVSMDAQGNIEYGLQPVVLNETLLEKIAQTTPGGKYFRATDEESLASIYDEIDLLEKTKIDSHTYKQKVELFRPFLFFALALIILSFLLKNTIFRTLP
jgi:Ca-activated chloride channel homolog